MQQNPLYSITSIGRPLEPKYATNRAIMILTPIATIIALVLVLLDGGSFGSALRSAFSSGITVLLVWMLGREIDPEYDLSAFVAVGLAFVAVMLQTTPPALLVIALILPLLRIVSRTVGPPAKRMDTAIIVGATLLLVFMGRWQLAIVTMIALIVDGLLIPAHRVHLFAVPVIGVGLGLHVVINGVESSQTISLLHLIGVLAISGAFIYTIVNTRMLTVRADVTRRPLILTRVRATMVLALVAGWVFLWNGDAGIEALSPVWMTLLGVSIYRVIETRIRQR